MTTSSIYCPYCHRYTFLTTQWGYNNQTGSWRAAECNNCHNVVIINDFSEKIYPTPLPEAISDRIAPAIKKDFEEATLCFSIEAYRAAAGMARRAIQNICLDKGASEDDKLNTQINWLFGEGIITKDLQSWAHEVRLVGNDALHPNKSDKDQTVSESDAKDILELLEQLCQVLYVAPAIASERKKTREQV